MTEPGQFKLHPLRGALYDELHSRPFHNIASPQRVTHLAACAQQEELQRSFVLIGELCQRYGVNQPTEGAVAFHQDFGDFTIHWERHVEFYAFTVMQPATPDCQPFQQNAIDLLPSDWLKQLPGEMVAAFHLLIDDNQLDYADSALCRYFEGHRVILSEVNKGRAQLFSAFKLHGDGYGRLLIRNLELNDSQTGQLGRRVMELETYRLLALLAVPMSKQLAPQLFQMDQQLADIVSLINNLDGSRAERDLLTQLTATEARLEGYRALTNRRFSATKAYHELILDRLDAVCAATVNGQLSFTEFVERRLGPALRTSESLQKWMEDLSTRIERASDLLRTRVNLNLQEQNRSLLSSMNRRSQLQFRLQETVEGLSIAAISYYMVGLIGYLLNGLPLDLWGLSKNVLLAGSIPLVLTSVWFITQRIKNRLIKQPVIDEAD